MDLLPGSGTAFHTRGRPLYSSGHGALQAQIRHLFRGARATVRHDGCWPLCRHHLGRPTDLKGFCHDPRLHIVRDFSQRESGRKRNRPPYRTHSLAWLQRQSAGQGCKRGIGDRVTGCGPVRNRGQGNHLDHGSRRLHPGAVHPQKEEHQGRTKRESDMCPLFNVHHILLLQNGTSKPQFRN